MTIERLAETYGIHANRRLALQRAAKYSAKCCSMGGSWVRWESWSEALMVFSVKVCSSERFEESWSLCETFMAEGEAQQVADSATPQARVTIVLLD